MGEQKFLLGHHNGPYSPVHNDHGSPESLNPSQILRNGQDVMLPTTTAAEYNFSLPHQRQIHSNIDLTPISAVSSFNLPALYDSSTLMTPVSMTGSPALSTRATSSMFSRDVKIEQMSPTTVSPYTFQDENDYSGKYNPPMKPKRPSHSMHINTSDSGFPSTFIPPEPYYGAFGVSGGPSTSRSIDTPPSLTYSPSLNSAGPFSGRSFTSHVQTPPLSATSAVNFRTLEQAPTLLPPTPADLRIAPRSHKTTRKDSFVNSTMILDSAPERSRVKKSPPRNRGRQPKRTVSSSLEGLQIPTDISPDDRLLLDLKAEGLEWKVIAGKFEQRTGQQLQVACLQMRHKRIRDRLREHPINNNHGLMIDTSYSTSDPRTPPGHSNVKSSSPRNWVQNPYSTTQNYLPERERYASGDRTPRENWSEIDSKRLHSSHVPMIMEDGRNRVALGSNAPYQMHNQPRENEQTYSMSRENHEYQRRVW